MKILNSLFQLVNSIFALILVLLFFVLLSELTDRERENPVFDTLHEYACTLNDIAARHPEAPLDALPALAEKEARESGVVRKWQTTQIEFIHDERIIEFNHDEQIKEMKRPERVIIIVRDGERIKVKMEGPEKVRFIVRIPPVKFRYDSLTNTGITFDSGSKQKRS